MRESKKCKENRQVYFQFRLGQDKTDFLTFAWWERVVLRCCCCWGTSLPCCCCQVLWKHLPGAAWKKPVQKLLEITQESRTCLLKVPDGAVKYPVIVAKLIDNAALHCTLLLYVGSSLTLCSLSYICRYSVNRVKFAIAIVQICCYLSALPCNFRWIYTTSILF